jgi:hypothetical protein
MERSECLALDNYLAAHSLGPSNVADAFIVHKRIGGDGAQGRARMRLR